MKDTYRTLAAPCEAEFRDRGSKFLAYAFPLQNEQDWEECLDSVKKAHSKARHHCYAYRLGMDKNNYRANDDGEPSGTAGRPILGQIDSAGLTNVFVVVVRYFGGTLLGTSGLINAYKVTTAAALEQGEVVEKIIEQRWTLAFHYGLMSPVMNALSRMNLEMADQRFTDTAEVDISIRLSEVAETLRQLKAYIGDVYLEEVDEEFAVDGLEIRPAGSQY